MNLLLSIDGDRGGSDRLAAVARRAYRGSMVDVLGGLSCRD